jgi:N-ethylmaleimide reductase
VFGRPFIANPDLVERLKSGAPLAALREDLLYTADAEGYSDYPSSGSQEACPEPYRRSGHL